MFPAMQSENNSLDVPANQPPYLAGLNDAQRHAVLTTEGPVLVLAGAGTGKTRVLTTRLAHLVMSGRAYPSQILAVTFTNKAAREMKERIGHVLGRPVEGWWLGTFHSLSARILRQYAERVGLKTNFTILDTDDQLRLTKQLIQVYRLDEKHNPPRLIAAMISRFKDRGLLPSQVTKYDCGGVADGKLQQLYQDYQDRLLTLNACDFGDLLLHCITLWRENADVLAEFQRKFRYIMVDEYQDANVAQYLWLRLLSESHKNLCCVGDDDQSIYSWRGAEVENILRFEKEFPDATVIRLEENYRSTPHILAGASALIAHNRGRLGKTLRTSISDGEKIRIRAAWDGEDEARFVADEIESMQRQKYSLADMAILVRAGFQTREFEERFLQLGIPYKVIGGLRFYERQEIRDALAYFRLCNSTADDLAFERVVNTPKRGLGDASLQTVQMLARAQKISLYEAGWRIVETDELKPKPRGSLRLFLDNVRRWNERLSSTNPVEWAQTVIEESGYTAMWQADKSIDAQGRLENLKELMSAIGEFETIPSFLEHVSLVMDANDNKENEQVTLMTLHGAKGLEFKIVFLPGWEESVFPNQRALDESGNDGLEEERRLAYVGITRAREMATITHALSRRMYGSWSQNAPSRFVAELPEAHIDHIRAAGVFDSGSKQMRLMPYKNALDDFDIYTPDEEIRMHFAAGEKVFHQKFGNGIILMVEGDKLDINFTSSGRKKVMSSFVSKV